MLCRGRHGRHLLVDSLLNASTDLKFGFLPDRKFYLNLARDWESFQKLGRNAQSRAKFRKTVDCGIVEEDRYAK
jgi:hypothetical protein